MPARNDQRGGVSCREIEGLLRLCDARGRLEPDSQDDFISVGEASVYPSVVVGCGRAMTVRDKVVVVAPPAAGSGESGSELYSLDTRYGKNQVSSGTFYRIEERFTRSGGDALCPDFDDSAGRIAGQAQVVQDSPSISVSRVENRTPGSSFLAAAPAATSATVIRPENMPPPPG